jgi:uncharacterized protein YqfB (UPF0267 family)
MLDDGWMMLDVVSLHLDRILQAAQKHRQLGLPELTKRIKKIQPLNYINGPGKAWEKLWQPC